MKNTKKLNMKFKKEDSKIYTLSLREIRDDITDEEVKAVMKEVVEKKIIVPKNINIAQVKEAGIVETDTKMLNVSE